MNNKKIALYTGVVVIAAAAVYFATRATDGFTVAGSTGYPVVMPTSGIDSFDQNYYSPDIPNQLPHGTDYLTYNAPAWDKLPLGEAIYIGGSNTFVGGTNVYDVFNPIDLSRTDSGNSGDCCCDPCGDGEVGSVIVTRDIKALGATFNAQRNYINQQYGSWLAAVNIG